MRKTLTAILYITAVMTMASCAKQAESGPNDGNKRFFDAWIMMNHPDAEPTELGVYILPGDVTGTGKEVEADGYVVAEYTITDLDGKISSYTNKTTAKQLGEYDTTSYYGAKVLTTLKGNITAGLADALIGMKVGGHRKFIIPSWLMSYKEYSTEEEYLDASSSYASTIYDITVKDFTEDIYEWQTDRIGEYFAANTDIFGAMTVKDTVKDQAGMYYKQLKAPVSTKEFPADTTIYINYTGKLLNGLVFDTTDEKVAKDNGLYSSGKEYKPVRINWGESFSEITMGSGESSVIKGFALTLWQMKAMEKGVGVFRSDSGYGSSGSGSSIPGYAPLVFEIEIVAKPED